MNIADLVIQGVDLEMAIGRLDNAVEDIEKLKVMVEEALDDTEFEIREGSRFRKLIVVRALINSVCIDTFYARTRARSALAYQQAALPQPEDVA